MTIKEFQGEFRFLSNFWMEPLYFNRTEYKSAEHAYQSMKTLNHVEQRRIMAAIAPGEAKRLGRTVKIRGDWEEKKLRIMERIVRAKFRTNSLRKKLIATGDQELIEGNNWGDTFWGVCRGRGENHLGKILMKVREELLEKQREGT